MYKLFATRYSHTSARYLHPSIFYNYSVT